ncbi:proline iminopeptidase [Halarchaeum acidiphilum MH1-52-1]|uniref:Proline iminopeptidase n=1 Tax=Halarchaeum acidiphilum MH1-52-1 TaxID=1261545 RepID=U3ADS1_9EURY|nr:proline iminopeptidase-family hydrolase [Halarchaeum acidiphilum]GAD52913.1 proline iminopeptidase [Halarchaeum acidiphilum MH1-52-1]
MSAKNYLDLNHSEGYFDVEDYRLYYRRFGRGDDVILTLHGGPGMPHDYLLPLARHGSAERSVYLYDQFGVGVSDGPAPGDFDRYTVDHYCDEVDAVRDAIGVDTITVYGQSWGGMLAQEYALRYPECVERLILANTMPDTQSGYESMRRVLDELPESDRERIEEFERTRRFDAPSYEAALDGAYRAHVCRMDPYPRPVADTFERINMDAYGIMWGPNEYVLLDEARLADWDVRQEIGGIEAPTLILTGTHDEISPIVAQVLAERIPDSKLVEFSESSHMPFWEEPDAHYNAVESFLDER